MGTFDNFGSPDGDYVASYLRFGQIALIFLGLFFVLPVAGYLVASATRLNAKLRQRQLLILSTLGAEVRTLRGALAFETVILVGVGALVAAPVSWIVCQTVTPTFAEWTSFPGRFTPPVYALPVSFAVIIAAALASSWWAASLRTLGTRNTSDNAVRLGSSWRWGVLLLGLAAATASTWWVARPSWILSGRLVTMLGIIAVAAPLCAALGYRLSKSDDVRAFLAGARLRRPSGALTRALAALASGLFVLSVGASMVQDRSEDPAALARAQSPDGVSVLEVRRPGADAQAAIKQFDVLSGRFAPDGSFIAEVSGRCSAVRSIVGSRSFDCPGEFFGVLAAGERAPKPGMPAPALLLGPRAEFLAGYVVRSTAEPRVRKEDEVVLVPLPSTTADALYDRLVGDNPLTNVRLDGSATVSGASELVGILDVFRWGSLFTVAMSLISVLISLVSLLGDRASGNNYLQILGLSPKGVATSSLIEISAAVAAICGLSMFGAWLWALATRSDERPVSLLAVAAPYLAVGAVVIGSAAVVIWALAARSGPGVVPDRDSLASLYDTFQAPTVAKARGQQSESA